MSCACIILFVLLAIGIYTSKDLPEEQRLMFLANHIDFWPVNSVRACAGTINAVALSFLMALQFGSIADAVCSVSPIFNPCQYIYCSKEKNGIKNRSLFGSILESNFRFSVRKN